MQTTTGPGPWPPQTVEVPDMTALVPAAGDGNIVLSTAFECLKPVKVGDRISQDQRLVDVYIKATRIDPKAFWLVWEIIYRNQNNEVVLTIRNTMVRHRTPEEVEAAGDARK